ncbi:MAG: glycosyltransferase family 2 protein [Lachnospiraceae bacterium]|nr:glycosyltransferase family 2 protein [Lachnospiraceae bacterium]
MKLETLISAVNKDSGLPAVMGVEGDAVLINQCDHDSEEVADSDKARVRIFNRNERGVGKSRNLALEKAEADLILFSDEDIRYEAGYAGKIIEAFEQHPEADVLFFNVKVCEERRTYHTEEEKKVGYFNLGRYPAYAAAMRREKIISRGIRYSLLFGGGAKYSNGEDSLFFMDCVRAGLKLKALPTEIGYEEPRESTWFSGYHEKFFFDRGVLYHFLYRQLAWLWGARFIFSKRKVMCREIKAFEAYKILLKGIKEGKSIGEA